jgi:putative heme degradation protein
MQSKLQLTGVQLKVMQLLILLQLQLLHTNGCNKINVMDRMHRLLHPTFHFEVITAVVMVVWIVRPCSSENARSSGEK